MGALDLLGGVDAWKEGNHVERKGLKIAKEDALYYCCDLASSDGLF